MDKGVDWKSARQKKEEHIKLSGITVTECNTTGQSGFVIAGSLRLSLIIQTHKKDKPLPGFYDSLTFLDRLRGLRGFSTSNL